MKLMRKSLSDQIYSVLKLEILQQKIPFGTKLVNRNLQERFEVSSSPVRDAINRLYNDGLISSITQSGATVVDFSLDFYIEMNEVLLCIAEAGVRLAGKKNTPEIIVPKLKEAVALQEKAVGTDKYYDYDYEFHRTFIDYSYNERLLALFKKYNVLHEVLVRYFYNPSSKKTQQESIAMHKQIIEAFEKSNIRKAMMLTEEHYETAEIIFRKLFEDLKKS